MSVKTEIIILHITHFVNLFLRHFSKHPVVFCPEESFNVSPWHIPEKILTRNRTVWDVAWEGKPAIAAILTQPPLCSEAGGRIVAYCRNQDRCTTCSSLPNLRSVEVAGALRRWVVSTCQQLQTFGKIEIRVGIYYLTLTEVPEDTSLLWELRISHTTVLFVEDVCVRKSFEPNPS